MTVSKLTYYHYILIKLTFYNLVYNVVLPGSGGDERNMILNMQNNTGWKWSQLHCGYILGVDV